jgi:hypothetical protein
MPKCINDPLKTYKGEEPSPKGLGYCAHAEKEGKIKKGKDGNKYIVKEVKNGSKRWIKINFKKLEKEAKKEFKKTRKEFQNIDMLQAEGLEEFFNKNIKKYIKKYPRIAIENINELITFLVEDFIYYGKSIF